MDWGERPSYLDDISDEDNWLELEYEVEEETTEIVSDHKLDAIIADFNQATEITTNDRKDSLASIQLAKVQEVHLARDLAYFSDQEKLNDILRAYGLTVEQVEEKLKQPRFKELVNNFQMDASKDANGFVRGQAAQYLEASLEHLYGIVTRANAKDTDKIKSVNLLAQLADAKPRNIPVANGGASGGPNVALFFGSNHPHQEMLESIVINSNSGDNGES